jgi:HSP20 family protein
MRSFVHLSRDIPIRAAGEGEDFEFLFRHFYRVRGPSLIATEKRWLPPTDLFETQEALVLIMDIAGIDRKEVSVRIEGHTLVIRGLRREISKYPKRHYHLMEMDFGPFERRFHLPRAVDVDKMEAHYNDGLLEVVMPKKASLANKSQHSNADGGASHHV